MKTTVSIAVVMSILFGQPLRIHAQAATGVIAGKVIGGDGGVASTTVQVIGADTAAVVGRAAISPTGEFSFSGLNVGTFIVQAISSTGDVIGTSLVTLAPGRMAVMDAVVRLVGEDASAVAARARIRAVAIIAALAATVRGIVTIVGNKPDASPSR